MNGFAPRTIVVGIGSHHGDDQAGWSVLQQLSLVVPESCRLLKAKVPYALLDHAEDADRLHIVDACQCDDCDLPVRRLEIDINASDGELVFLQSDSRRTVPSPLLRADSSHHIDLISVLRLLAELGSLPSQVVVWAVSGNEFGAGRTLSDQCAVNVNRCVDLLAREVGNA